MKIAIPLLFISVVSVALYGAAPAPAMPAELNNAIARSAAQFVATAPASDAGLDAWLAARGASAGAFRDEVRTHVAAMLAATRKGLAYDSELFWEEYRDWCGTPLKPIPLPRPRPIVPPKPLASALAEGTAPGAGAAARRETIDELDERKLELQLQAAEEAAKMVPAGSEERKTVEAKVEALRAELNHVRSKINLTRKEAALAAAEAARKKQDNPSTNALVAGAKKDLVIAKAALEELKPQPQAEIAALTHSGPTSFIHAGVRLLSPYKFTFTPANAATNTPAKGTLETAGKDDTASFIEFVYSNRAAWSPLWLKDLSENNSRMAGAGKGWFGEFLGNFDFETRLTYNFSKASSDATAIVGTGDFGAEVSIARLFAGTFQLHDKQDWKKGGWSIAPEVSYGVVTDRGSFDARQRLFGGAGYTVSYNLGGQDARWLLFHARLGAAKVESLKFVNDTTREVELIRGNLPHYRFHRTVAFEADVLYPLSRDAHLTFGGRVYSSVRPNSWTLYMGYTTPISKIMKGLFPNFGDASEPAAAEKPPASSAGAAKPAEMTTKPSRGPAIPSL
ncbi:MAG: hypothetical protein Q8N18_07670 [Opitutaceae bacterium]|nr:hypothetical protein [Opitutaceae bacterium]